MTECTGVPNKVRCKCKVFCTVDLLPSCPSFHGSVTLIKLVVISSGSKYIWQQMQLFLATHVFELKCHLTCHKTVAHNVQVPDSACSCLFMLSALSVKKKKSR